MIVEQIYTSCLSQGSYYIESNNEVAIIDPIREIDSYIERASKTNSKIKYIFETHLHADFISGHITLAKRTGADIVYGPNVETSFNILSAKDGQEFKIGDITIHAIHTPGHTLESTTYLLKDENGDEYAIFTGDTLFIGDVGRPDLSQNSEVDSKYLAGLLYDSLRNKIMTLDDKIIIDSVKKTGCLVTAEEHNYIGGLGESISGMLSKKHPTPQEFVAVNDSLGESGTPSQLMEKYGLNKKTIIHKIKKVINRKIIIR